MAQITYRVAEWIIISGDQDCSLILLVIHQLIMPRFWNLTLFPFQTRLNLNMCSVQMNTLNSLHLTTQDLMTSLVFLFLVQE